MIFAYPCDYFDHKIPEDIFSDEYRIAMKFNLPVMLVDYDQMRLTVKPSTDSQSNLVMWRGWQMTADKYTKYLNLIERRGYVPLTDVDAYMSTHAAKNYIPLLPENSSLDLGILDYPECLDPLCVRRVLGGEELVFVKDYVKSVYGHFRIDTGWNDNVLVEWLSQLISSRGSDFAGGLIFKTWCDDLSDEYRIFIYNGQTICWGRHGNGSYVGRTPDLAFAENIVLPSQFYTVDIAWSDEFAQWFVIECGDGQVSEIPREALNDFYGHFNSI